MISNSKTRILATFVIAVFSINASKPHKAAPKPSAVPREYDFRGARLGMTLESFKQLPYLDVSDRKHAQIFCSDDQSVRGDTDFIELYLDSTEAHVGVVNCGYFQANSEFYETNMSGWMGASMAIGASGYVARDVQFSFIRDPSDQLLKLFRITLTTNSNAAPNALAGLTEKFGPPSSLVNDKTQNMMGAQFDHTLAIWLNPLSEVRFESPWSEIDKMRLRYDELRLSNLVDAAVAKMKGPDAAKM